jgi:hypothetical protein
MVEQHGKFPDVVVDHVLCLIPTCRHGPAIGSLEEPTVLVVPFNTETTFMNKSVVT